MGSFCSRLLAISTTTTAQRRLALTVILGFFVPLFSLALSHCGGVLLEDYGRTAEAPSLALGVFALCLTCVILAVSLDHLRWAIQNVTRSPHWQALALAVCCDLGIIFTELACVYAHGAGITVLLWMIKVSVTCLSIAFNCWAFTMQPTHNARSESKSSSSRGEN